MASRSLSFLSEVVECLAATEAVKSEQLRQSDKMTYPTDCLTHPFGLEIECYRIVYVMHTM